MGNFNNKVNEAAAKFLTHRGYDIIEETWKREGGMLPVDIVAMEDETIVFVSTKGRNVEKGSSFDDGNPDRNKLTNFEVRFDEMDFDGLWLAAHGYRIDSAYEKEEADDAVPVARRKKGWHFLLASAEELEHVELVVVDGEAIIKRVCGELIDLQSFDERAYECIGSSLKGLHDRICELFEYLQKITGEMEPVIPGVPRQVVTQIVAARENAEDDGGERWGDLHEAGW